ncbi:MAG: hypothetical protein HY835_03190 [Anaerolineae bacterium]|nr:hypothetical protein [Anaerolineae bacterium]
MPDTLTPQDLANEGQKLYKGKRYQESAAAFEQAARGWQAAGDAAAAAEAANNSSVAFLKAGDAQRALDIVEGTSQVFEAAKDSRRQGMAIANRAAALEGLNRLQEALAEYQIASDVLKLAEENELRSYVLQCISALQIRTGKELQALASMDSALENRENLSLREKLLKKLIKTPFNMLNRK